MLFLHIKPPRMKKIRWKWYELYHYHGNVFYLKLQSIILNNKQFVDKNVFLLVFKMS